MLKIPTALAVALLLPACAASPPRQGAASASAATAAGAPASAPARPAARATASTPDKRLLSGYVRVMKDGVATYCRQDLKTGSHIVVQQRCLSQREYDSVEDDTRRDMDRIRNTISPMQGTSGGSAH